MIQHSLASDIAPPCSSIFPFDIARLFQNVASFGFREMASVYRVIDRLNSLSTSQHRVSQRSRIRHRDKEKNYLQKLCSPCP